MIPEVPEKKAISETEGAEKKETEKKVSGDTTKDTSEEDIKE